MKACACTIVSANYIGYARSLMESLAETNPDIDRKVLLVDENQRRLKTNDFHFELIEAREIGIPNFTDMAFRFGIMELNTNVKPFFLKYLLENGYDAAIYFDPDIIVFEPLSDLQSLLTKYSVIITPHVNRPIDDDKRPNEQDHLLNGVFNLGFTAVSNCSEGKSFLDWWGNRCYKLGFDDLRSGLFVDQKWIDYVPCFFPNHYVLRNPGYNVAYWNLQEREISENNGKWSASGEPLIFFHFSGFPSDAIEKISRHQDRFTTENYPAVRPLLEMYRTQLTKMGHNDYKTLKYAYGQYDSGENISIVARRYYSISSFQGNGENPFLASSQYYRWARKKRIHASKPSGSKDYNYRTLNQRDIRLLVLNHIFTITRFVLGADKYYMLMKFFGYFSVLRHQSNMM